MHRRIARAAARCADDADFRGAVGDLQHRRPPIREAQQRQPALLAPAAQFAARSGARPAVGAPQLDQCRELRFRVLERTVGRVLACAPAAAMRASGTLSPATIASNSASARKRLLSSSARASRGSSGSRAMARPRRVMRRSRVERLAIPAAAGSRRRAHASPAHR